MSRKAILKSAAVDVLVGFLALCCLLAVVIIHNQNDLRLFSLVTAALFFLAGVLRGTSIPQNLPLKALLIGSGGVVPVIALRVTNAAFTEHGYVPLFVALSLLLIGVGVETRRLVGRGRSMVASLLAIVSLAAAMVAVRVALPPLMAKWSSSEVNRTAPDFSFSTFDGKPVSSADLHGRVVVLAFWATWCDPCRQELPEIQKAYEEYNNNSRVSFYAVGGPWGDDTPEKESTFANQTKLKLPLVFDSGGTAKALGVSTFPSLVILDAAGHIRLIHHGYDASEHLAPQVVSEVAAIAGNQM